MSDRDGGQRADERRLRGLILSALGLIVACGGKAEIDGGGSSGSGGRGSPSGGGSRCEEPRTDLGGHFERCADGTVHRATVDECPSRLPRDQVFGLPLTTGQGGVGSDAPASGTCPGCCQQDSDCTAGPLGHCEPASEYGTTGRYCEYGCVSDSQCQGGQICVCGALVGTCVSASCKVDADCPGDLLCSQADLYPGCDQISFACQTERDTCSSRDDCGGDEPFCAVEYDGSARACSGASCTPGRPFLVGDAARLAPCEPRSDWYTTAAEALPSPASAPPLHEELREALREGWLRQGLMEHASVAAFARFALQLASLGAPPDLLAGTAAAMLDEIGHARGCFELARRHGGRDVGPGPLPVADALQAWDAPSVVVCTILEGCIGETVAALEAAEVLAHTEDGAARALLARIATEEAAHAELAWRFVAWALERGDSSLRERVASTFEAAVGASEPPSPSAGAPPFEAQLLAYGLASEPLRLALRRRALSEIVAPCAQALLERHGAPRRAPVAAGDRDAQALA
jgi:hypothetical protein